MRRRLTILFCTVLPVLSACSEQRDLVREKYTGERYGAPVVGSRRVPMLNPGAAKMNNPAMTKPPETPIVTKPPKDAAPYDQYDAKGNDVSRTNYVNKWMGDKPAEKLADKPASAPVEKPARKQFKGINTPDAEPLEVMPQRNLLPVVEPVLPSIPKQDKPEIISAPAGLEPEEENGVFLPEPAEKPAFNKPAPEKNAWPKKRSDNRSPDEFAQLQPAAGDDSKQGYPRLSSVPKVPPEFTAVKQEKAAVFQELQSKHSEAVEQKKMIEQEPSELPPTTLPQVDGMLREINGAIHGRTPIASNHSVIEQNDLAIKKLESITAKRPVGGITVASIPRIDRIIEEASSAAGE